jgi:MGT family glycosyltransferase
VKITIYSLPQHGHVNPTLALTQELVHRGHSVTYYLTEEFREKIENVGGIFRPLGTELDIYAEARRAVNATRNGVGLSPSGALRVFITFMTRTMAHLDELREELVADDPDLIIYDPMSLWGNILARNGDTPRATFYTTYPMIAGDTMSGHLAMMFVKALSPRILLDILRLGGSLVKARLAGSRVPVSPAGLFTSKETLNLVPLPRSMVPNAAQLDGTYLFFGPNLMLGYAHRGEPLPEATPGKCLYVSMGSTPLNNQPELFAAVIEGFGGSEWRVIMNVGEADGRALGPIPSNIVLRTYVPQLTALEHHADVFLTHGGMNSVMESCYFGVPMMVLPLQPETQITAGRVEAKGLGKSLDPSEITGGRLRAVAEGLLGDVTLPENLRVLQQELRTCGGARQAADAIAAYVVPPTRSDSADPGTGASS